MAVGPGKYDALCTKIREETKAEGAILMVFNGNQGSGFSVQAPFELTVALPAILRDLARQIDDDLAKGHA
jgi:hypothetical protein